MKEFFGLLTAVVMAVLLGSNANAGVIPYGVQGNVSAATVANWGWTEIHRSGAASVVAPGQGVSSVLAQATGDHVMMGFWDVQNQVYAILGAGETSVVTAATYAHFNDDNNSAALNNWSNGLNFYRTSGHGSWGFTTSNYAALSSADVMLGNGIQTSNGKTETPLARGMSIHLHGNGGGDFSAGYAFNVTGSNFVFATGNYERVFFTTDAPADNNGVPEPGSLAIFGIGALGLMGVRRRKRS